MFYLSHFLNRYSKYKKRFCCIFGLISNNKNIFKLYCLVLVSLLVVSITIQAERTLTVKILR